MKITSARFIKSIVESDDLLDDKRDKIAFIGRSNVGKSSTINALTNQKNLAKTSSFPGHTKQINVFLINKKVYLIDLPGYGFTKTSREAKDRIQKLIYWYLLDSDYQQKKVVVIIDAQVGLTGPDREIIRALEVHEKDIVVVANKVDKIKKSEYRNQLQKIQMTVGPHKIIPFSAEKKIGIKELIKEILE